MELEIGLLLSVIIFTDSYNNNDTEEYSLVIAEKGDQIILENAAKLTCFTFSHLKSATMTNLVLVINLFSVI